MTPICPLAIQTYAENMPLGKVEALLMNQGLFGKIFGYGTLVLRFGARHKATGG
jgi:hypothetical protein